VLVRKGPEKDLRRLRHFGRLQGADGQRLRPPF
jgi:hypothetical protein